jgi:GTP-binding protein EngB required for normal cell division
MTNHLSDVSNDVDHPSIEYLHVLADIVRRFDLKTLAPTLQACEQLAKSDALLDVAVLGQFKCGKSSLLNAILGSDLFPVGALPATAVITRARFGPELNIAVTHLDGTAESIAPSRIAEFVTETGNPRNVRQVAVVDIVTPTLRDWPGIRLVDTPGLGSIHLHNTAAAQEWMPNVAVALLVVSVERPFADEDRRLLNEARQHAGRVVVVLSKWDLLADADRAEVLSFLDRALRATDGEAPLILQFSTRSDRDRWVNVLENSVLRPLANDLEAERRRTLAHKVTHLAQNCRGYLEVGLHAAERSDADRDQLRRAVLDESVNAAVIRDELLLAEQRVAGTVRSKLEKVLFASENDVSRRLRAALAAELPTWTGHLAEQAGRFENWIAEHLQSELQSLSQNVHQPAVELLNDGETRFRRIVEAFRDRLNRNIRAAMGITISQAVWQAKPARLSAIPIRVSRTFMTPWEMLWWLLPMKLIGWLFRRHVLGLIGWEVNKNLARLTVDWSDAVKAALTDQRNQASEWVDAELATLDRMLGQQKDEASVFRAALDQLNKLKW